ncbi:hypothetical protein ES703_27533 [subsurface metagenome]
MKILFVSPGLLYSEKRLFERLGSESVICETSVIVTDDCGCGELVREIHCGYLVKFGDVNGLKEKMRYVLENPEEGKKMVEIGKKYIIKIFTWDKVVRMGEIYESCLI